MADPVPHVTIPNPNRNLGGDGSLIFDGMPDYSEIHPELRSPATKIRVYREMLDNSPLISRALADLTYIILGGTVTYEAAQTEKGQEVADMVKAAIEGMITPLSDVLSDMVTAVPWGWNVSEVTWKTTPDGIAPARIEQRPQWTLYGWTVTYNSDGSKQYSMIQQLLSGPVIQLPAAKCIHVTMGQGTGGPEGKAVLHHVWVPYRDARNINQTLMVGFRRSMVGILVLKPPGETCAAVAGTAEYDARTGAEAVLATLEQGERTVITLPGATVKGTGEWKLDLLKSPGGNETANAIALADRYDQRILIAWWAGYLALGQAGAGGGGRAQSESQIDVVESVYNGIGRAIFDALNAQLVNVLCDLRGVAVSDRPKMVWKLAKNTNLLSYWQAFKLAYDTGAIQNHPADEAAHRAMFGMAPRDPAATPALSPPPVVE